MRIQRKISFITMLVSVFILLSSYLFTTPDKRARFLQAVYYLPTANSGGGVVYKPRLSELVVASNDWTTEMNKDSLSAVTRVLSQSRSELEDALTDIYETHYHYNNPNFYGFTIRYSYLATICLFFFFVGLYAYIVKRCK